MQLYTLLLEYQSPALSCLSSTVTTLSLARLSPIQLCCLFRCCSRRRWSLGFWKPLGHWNFLGQRLWAGIGGCLSMLGCSLKSGSHKGPLSATFFEKPAYPQSSCLLLSCFPLCST